MHNIVQLAGDTFADSAVLPCIVFLIELAQDDSVFATEIFGKVHTNRWSILVDAIVHHVVGG